MKSKDYAAVVLLMVISGLLAAMLSNVLILNKKSTITKVEVVQPISKDFNFLNKPYFKANSINPTRDITIDEAKNTKPLQ